MNVINNDRGRLLQHHGRRGVIRDRSLFLAVSLVAACRGADAMQDSDSARVVQAVASDGASGATDRTARRTNRGPGSKAALALAGIPQPIPTSTQFDITGFLQETHTS